jgi:hypothetical protein
MAKNMNILKTKYYEKKTAPIATALGDLALLLIPAVQILVAGAPNLTEPQQYWVQGVCTLLLIIAKFLLKLWKDESETSAA